MALNGPVVSGITTMASSGAMSLPRGDTAYRGGRGRGIFGGGEHLVLHGSHPLVKYY